jgi:hypothetical protein
MLLSGEIRPSEADVLCSQCSTNLPDGAQFCLSCGQPAISTANRTDLAPVPVPGSARPHLLWLLALVFLGAVLWGATSQSPAAQRVQEFVHRTHTETIVDSALSLNPRSFFSCKFSVPAGAQSISITGEFTATPGSQHGGGSKAREDRDTNIEAYVLTDAAFAVWNGGYSTQTEYESGSVANATLNAPLPAGAGVYHLVFSNKSSPRTKNVHATVLLRYKSWLPDSVVRLKDQFWSWIGLALFTYERS